MIQPQPKDTPPFVDTQRLFHLQPAEQGASLDQQRNWLRPETFRLRRRKSDGETDDREPEAALQEREPGGGELAGWVWREVEQRERFLTDLAYNRLCITVDAGVGKTICLRQTQYLRHCLHRGHLAILVPFAMLPKSTEEYLDHEDNVPWLVDHFKTVAGSPRMSVGMAKSLIAHKIRAGQFTLLVDALDQNRQIEEPQVRAEGLAGFLQRYPAACCIVSGRPYAIQRYWDPLFGNDQIGPWQFAQVDVFTPEEQTAFVGAERMEKLRLLDADVLVIPRALEAVRLIPRDEMDGIRTASDVYWRSMLHTLQEAILRQKTPLKQEDALLLFALLGFETVRAEHFAGVPPGRPTRRFIQQVWKRNSRTLDREAGISNTRQFQQELEYLGRLNENIDYAVLDHEGLTQIYWRNRTLQDFFAALWITRYATKRDRRWLAEHLFVRADRSTHDWQAMWRLAAEMPGQQASTAGTIPAARDDDVYARSLAVLYTPAEQPKATIRSTEMIYRSWPTMLRLSDLWRTDDSPWTALDIETATERAQQRVRKLVKSDAEPPDAKNFARAAVFSFLADFPRILHHNRDVERKRIAEEFESWYEPVPKRKADSLEFWMSSEEHWGGGNREPHRSHILQRFDMAKYTVTNALYELFDSNHFCRYSSYDKYSPEPHCPVICLEWYDSWCVATWLGGRLPTEHEWEYACRAQPGTDKSSTQFCFGDSEERLEEYAWFGLKPPHETRPVGKKKPNAFGLYDMHGNVWEWTSNWFHDDVVRRQRAQFEGTSRVLRGGSYVFSAAYCRSAIRTIRPPSVTDNNTGVRVARALRENL